MEKGKESREIFEERVRLNIEVAAYLLTAVNHKSMILSVLRRRVIKAFHFSNAFRLREPCLKNFHIQLPHAKGMHAHYAILNETTHIYRYIHARGYPNSPLGYALKTDKTKKIKSRHVVQKKGIGQQRDMGEGRKGPTSSSPRRATHPTHSQ